MFIVKRFNSTHQSLEHIRSKLGKYNVANFYETRLSKHKNVSRTFPKRAAVLIPISVRQEVDQNGNRIERTYFTLSKRAEKLSSHKGEVAFLGGIKDDDSESDMETAYREAKEEANLTPKSLSFIAQLCPTISKAQILVTPVIAHLDKSNFNPILNKDEVEMLFELPTDRFLKNDDHKSKIFSNRSFGRIQLHYFKDVIDGKNVHTWGMTAFLAIVVSSLLHSRQPEFEVFEGGKKFNLENINEYFETQIFSMLSA